nr:glycine oxidase-like [Nerophis lumbriciformis]
MPAQFSDPLPTEVDVVVIGGGVIGISTAWYLRGHGLSVLVCDKGRVAGEQSSRNWGWVRVTARDPDEVPIAIDSVSCWESIAAQLDDDIGFTRGGVLTLASSETEMAEYEAWCRLAAEHELQSIAFSKDQIVNHIDVATRGFVGGIVTPRDARAEPFKAVPALARGVQNRGGMIREGCAVRTVDLEAGKVAGIVTEHGRVRSQAVVVAAGAWSSMLLSNMEIKLPQLTVRSTVARTKAALEVYSGAAGLHDLYIRRRQDGGYTVASGFTEHTIGADSFRYLFKFLPSTRETSEIGLRLGRNATQQSVFKKTWTADQATPFESHRVLNPSPSLADLKRMRGRLARRIPKLAGIEFAESWAGMIDATPDVVPVMDEISSHPGLFLATGFSGHGFGIGPGAGKVMAELVSGRAPQHDLTRFRFSRFSDGSKIKPGPAI